MINYAPIPLLEASLFLANQAAGVSWTSYMERTAQQAATGLQKHPEQRRICRRFDRKKLAKAGRPGKGMSQGFHTCQPGLPVIHQKGRPILLRQSAQQCV